MIFTISTKHSELLVTNIPQVEIIIFSKRATSRLNNIAEFIYKESRSESITNNYLQRMKDYLISVLLTFPESGSPIEEMCKNCRKIAYQKYAIIYRINLNLKRIEVLNIFRENLP